MVCDVYTHENGFIVKSTTPIDESTYYRSDFYIEVTERNIFASIPVNLTDGGFIINRHLLPPIIFALVEHYVTKALNYKPKTNEI